MSRYEYVDKYSLDKNDENRDNLARHWWENNKMGCGMRGPVLKESKG